MEITIPTVHDDLDFYRDMRFAQASHPTLGEVAHRLESALRASHYENVGWYSTNSDDGFAAVTRIEQIDDNCHYLPGNNRWLATFTAPVPADIYTWPIRMGLSRFGHALFIGAPASQWRVFAFLVGRYFVHSARAPLIDDSRAFSMNGQWSAGEIPLANQVLTRQVSADDHFHVLSYVFTQQTSASEVIFNPDPTTGRTVIEQLKVVGILDALRGSP